jgi:hypothetical protein
VILDIIFLITLISAYKTDHKIQIKPITSLIDYRFKHVEENIIDPVVRTWRKYLFGSLAREGCVPDKVH